MNKGEITDIVYDTLMENKGKPYEAFDLSKVDNQEVDAQQGFIMFRYGDLDVKMDIQVRMNGGAEWE